MRFNVKTISFALVLIAGVAVLALSLSKGVMAVSASYAQNGQLHVTKDCTGYQGNAGQSCTIKSSNLGEIKVGSTVFYDQNAGIPAGLLDSNVVLDAGYGNRALGRCTLDFGQVSDCARSRTESGSSLDSRPVLMSRHLHLTTHIGTGMGRIASLRCLPASA